MADKEFFDLLGLLLNYPSEEYGVSCEACARLATEIDPVAASYLGKFTEALRGWSTEQIQELFVQTFDLNPICALEIGWHLFGDKYERGEFLVRMRREMDRYGVEQSVELPDHISHVLSVFGRMEEARAQEFAAALLFPAMEKMRAALAAKASPYRHLFRAAVLGLETRCPRVAGGEA